MLRDGFDAKERGEAWERDLSSDAGIDRGSGDGAQKLYAPLMEDQVPKVRTTSPLVVIFLSRECAADPALTPQQPDARTSLSREELRREHAWCGSRAVLHFLHPH